MSEIKKANREDMIGIISEHTGYTKAVVREILKSRDLAIAELLSQGYSIKDLKMYRLDLVERDEKKAWDGINKRSFIIPKRTEIRFVPLKGVKNALKELNE